MTFPESPRQFLQASKHNLSALACAVALALTAYGENAAAAKQGVDILNIPLVPLIHSTGVPANLMYIHDNSDSMGYPFIPDDLTRTSANYDPTLYGPEEDCHKKFTSAKFNMLFYDPEKKYELPLDANGNPLENSPARKATRTLLTICASCNMAQFFPRLSQR